MEDLAEDKKRAHSSSMCTDERKELVTKMERMQAAWFERQRYLDRDAEHLCVYERVQAQKSAYLATFRQVELRPQLI